MDSFILQTTSYQEKPLTKGEYIGLSNQMKTDYKYQIETTRTEMQSTFSRKSKAYLKN